MKKLTLLTLLCLVVTAGINLAATTAKPAAAAVPQERYGVQVMIAGNGIFDLVGAFARMPYLLAPPACGVINIGKEYELNVGFGSYGLGAGKDAATRLYIAGIYYMVDKGDTQYGPMLSILTGSVADPASQNGVTIISLGAAFKSMLFDNLGVKIEGNLFQLVSGKVSNADVKDANTLLPPLGVSIVAYL